MVTKKNIVLKDFSNILFSRKLATEIFEKEIKNYIFNDELIFIFDFKGVDTVTHSFADELFRILFEQIGNDKIRNRTSFSNYSPFNEKVLMFAMNNNKKLFLQ
ncbi:STAS-like domain-containing protein [Flavobacterium sp. AJR]|uniref:STAS-like domain-containing protein n=1 Tax=Flavobacterium sp. AJR TaxID=1979369 RepID=UPI000A3D7ED6|nr:STAS-like domain-containing protein [Flavobacterium sp. AJR]OUL63460.1 hypothetical protein B8T70_04990 [Flavobacterium sp. AJR]